MKQIHGEYPTRSFFFLSGVMKPFLAFLPAAVSSRRFRTSAFLRSTSARFCFSAYRPDRPGQRRAPSVVLGGQVSGAPPVRCSGQRLRAVHTTLTHVICGRILRVLLLCDQYHEVEILFLVTLSELHKPILYFQR